MTIPPRYDWDSVATLWGTTADVDIAKVLGCTPQAVGAHRRRHKIPAYCACLPTAKRARARFDWSLAVSLWGKATDNEIAKVVGCTSHAVGYYRHIHGIALYSRPGTRANVDWSQVEWGTNTDANIARTLGCTTAQVGAYRRTHGIPSRYRKTQRDIPADLGLLSDLEIATREGVAVAVIRAMRAQRGIPVFVPEHVRERRRVNDTNHNSIHPTRRARSAEREARPRARRTTFQSLSIRTYFVASKLSLSGATGL